MTVLQFITSKSIICKPGACTDLGRYAATLGIKHALVVTDPGLIKCGVPDKGIASLKKLNIEVTTYSDVVADPPESVIMSALEMAKANHIDGVIGLGGGSSMDTAKLIAFLMVSEQKLEDIYGIDNAMGTRLPLIQIPTTAGTGSEVTPISIVTTGEAQKKGVVAPVLLPDLAILDADLTIGLPPPVTAATGVDAMVHAIEAYTTKHKKNPISDALAKEALRLLNDNIRRAWAEGDHREARSNMLLGACLAGMAFCNAPVAAVHALAYPIGGHFHVPHGLSNSLVLPHVLRFNRTEAKKEYAELASIIVPGVSGSDDAKTDALISSIEQLIADLKLENRLSQVGVKQEDLGMLAKDAMKQTRLLVNNPSEVTESDAFNIYAAAL